MISIEVVNKSAKLSKLQFQDHEITKLQKDLLGIFEMFNSLSELDVQDVEPLKSVLTINLPMRKDEVIEQNLQNEIFKNIPKKTSAQLGEFNYFVVPKVIE